MNGQEGWLIDWFITGLREMSPHTALLSVLGVLGLCGLGLPIPEDIILITAGFLASLGKFPLWVAIGLGIVGVLSGDAVLFFLGRTYGDDVFDLPLVRRTVPRHLVEAARVRVQANARFICFVARFLPGLRSPIYLTAGAMGVKPSTYLTQDGLAASISVPLWVWIGWYFGEEIERALLVARDFQRGLLVAVGLAIVTYMLYRWRRSRLTAREQT